MDRHQADAAEQAARRYVVPEAEAAAAALTQAVNP